MLEPGDPSQYSDQAMGWTTCRQVEEIYPAMCSDPHNLLCSEHWGALCPELKQLACETGHCIASRTEVYGAVLHYTQGQLCVSRKMF
jgi:hypothetical protein